MEWKNKFVENLKEIRSKITPELFLYLETCTKREQILDAIEAVLDINYNEDLDWLYSTLKPVYTTERFIEVPIISQFPSIHTFQYDIQNDGIVININEAALREHITKTISADGLLKNKSALETFLILSSVTQLPIKFGEIRK